MDPALNGCRDRGRMTSHLSAGHSVPSTSLPWLPLSPTGSDQWKMAERKLFNKGIAIYKKDFFLVQQLVSWGSVSGARGSQGRAVRFGAPSAGGGPAVSL